MTRFAKIAVQGMLLSFLVSSFLLAQSNGRLVGTVSAAESGEELPGASVVLKGTVLGTSALLDGSFEIENIRPGNYQLIVSQLGYQSVEQTVEIAAGTATDVSIKMISRPIDIGAVLTEEERVYSAASSQAVRAFDIKVRPTRSSQDMLQMVPGIFIAQHAGGGKAEQIFIRGFDADHGTDINIAVDGVPANMVSHGHGQGYADLHYLISDVVEGIEVFKGPYSARYGNLATAGAVSFTTRDHIEQNSIRIEGGAYNTARVTTLVQIPGDNDHQNAYVAGQFHKTDGPVDEPQDFQRFNLFGKFHSHLSARSTISLSAGAFSSGWDASGQVPQRAVDSGLIGRFGAIDDLEGGTTSRQDFNLQYRIQGSSNSELQIQTYAFNYDFKLFSNFTFFLENPTQGDMIEQTDKRQVFGVNSDYRFTRRLGGLVLQSSLGSGFRADNIAVSLWQSPSRIRSTPLVDDDIFERNLFLWAQEEILFSPRFRIQLGLRGDYFTYNVEDKLERPGFNNGLPHASGYAQQGIASPKFSMVFSPVADLDLFANAGSGFHSNDARNIVISQRIQQLYRSLQNNGLSTSAVTDSLVALNLDAGQRDVETLPRAIGAEIGFRTRLLDRFNVSAAAWWLGLEREYVYVGDAGTTELSDPTTRLGIDVEVRARLLRWLFADIDVNLADGRVDNAPEGEDFIPLAPRLTATGGLTVVNRHQWEGGIRFRHIADRPANEDNSVVADGYTIFDLSAAYRLGDIKFLFWAENLFDVAWNEAQFDTESRLFNEPAPVSGLHFTPGNPRNVRLGISYGF